MTSKKDRRQSWLLTITLIDGRWTYLQWKLSADASLSQEAEKACILHEARQQWHTYVVPVQFCLVKTECRKQNNCIQRWCTLFIPVSNRIDCPEHSERAVHLASWLTGWARVMRRKTNLAFRRIVHQHGVDSRGGDLHFSLRFLSSDHIFQEVSEGKTRETLRQNPRISEEEHTLWQRPVDIPLGLVCFSAQIRSCSATSWSSLERHPRKPN